MARSLRRTWGLASGLVIVVVLAGCGSGVDTAAPKPTTTTLSVEDQRAAGEFATAMQRLLRMRQLGVSGADARCAGDAVVEGVGLDRLREAGLTPSEVTALESLDDGGVELRADEVDALGDSIGECLPDSLGDSVIEAFGFEDGGELAACVADVIVDSVADGLARQVANGADSIDFTGFAEGQAAGIRCRWKSQPERPSSGVTLDDGRPELEGALTEELSTPPPDLDAPTLASEQLDCFVPTVVDTLGASNVASSGTTARELARFLTGEGTEPLGFEISRATAESLARDFLGCVTAQEILRPGIALAGVPEDLIDPLIECVVDRLPGDNLADNLALNFRLGAAGQATREGQAILSEQAAAGFECGQEIRTTTPS